MYQDERPPFHPNDSRNVLDHYQGLQRQLDGDIYSTNTEIGLLNNKIVKYFKRHSETIMTGRRL